MATLTVVHGDLVTQDADAIVNPTNAAARGGGGGVDGAIHAAGGPSILKECLARFPAGIAVGEAGWTTAGRLSARWVIHTVGPEYQGGQGDAALLRSCYERALDVADEVRARTIAFPLMGAGARGWPRQVAIEAAVSTILGKPSRVAEVRLVVPDEGGYRQTRAELLLRCPPSTTPGSIGALFERAPVQFGLRGDAYLWRELRAQFAAAALPPDWFELRRLLVDAIEAIVGDSYRARESAGWYDAMAAIHVPAFDPGHGMSAGAVHVPWWSHTGLPILLDRFEVQRHAEGP